MKKLPKKKKQSPDIQMVEKPPLAYFSSASIPVTKDFSFSDFKRVADQAPFSIAEWATMLHLSERTLQRYAKNEGTFAPMNAERVLQIARVLKQGKLTFGKIENFYQWLKEEPTSVDGLLSLESLQSFDGIQKVLAQLARIQQGIFA